MTWLELAELINGMPEQVLQYEACVWLPCDYVHVPDDFAKVIGLHGYDLERQICEDNLPSIEIEEG